MRRDQGRAAFAANERQEFSQHLVRRLFIQIAGWLISQHQIRLVRKTSGYGHALLLPARKLAGAMVEPMAQPKRSQQLFRARFCFGARGARNQLRQDHIFARIEIGEQMVELIDEPQMLAAKHGARARI